MQTVAIVSQKGGSGKTTTAVNLAVAAEEADLAVLVVDLDIQASATTWHQARESESPPVLPTHHAALGRVVDAARKEGVELLLIDTAGKTEVDTRQAIEAADIALVPCRPSAMDLRAIVNTIRLCQGCGKTPYVLLSQVEPQGAASGEARAVLEGMGVHVLSASLGRRAAFLHSINDGRGVVEYEPAGKAASEVRVLLEELRNLAS